jgi:phage FluMu protein Com
MDMELALWVGTAALVFGAIGMVAASSKGNAAAGFWWGFLLGPLGIIIAMLMPASAGRMKKRCPHCKAALPAHKVQRCQACGGMLVKKSFHASDPLEQWEARQRAERDG